MQALTQQAIKDGGPPTMAAEASGSLRGTIQELQAAITDLGGRVVKERLPGPHRSGHDTLFVWDDSLFQFDASDEEKDIDVWLGSRDPERYKKLAEIADKFVAKRTSAGRAYAVVIGREGPKLKSIGLAGVPVVEDNYTQEVLEDFAHIVEDFSIEPPCGRVVIFDGVPGTGKTYLVRALLHAVPDAVFVMVPPSIVPELSGPSFIDALISSRDSHRDTPTVLIIEDADSCLVPRAADNMGAISSLLNMGDGVLGAMFKLRIVATTNAGHMEDDEALDPAILRPGRLCRRVHVGALPGPQCEAVYKRLTGNNLHFPKSMTVAEVYRMARDKGWKPKPEKRSMGFAAEPQPRIWDGDMYGDD